MCGGFGRWEDNDEEVGRPESTPEVEQIPDVPEVPQGDDAADAARLADFYARERVLSV